MAITGRPLKNSPGKEKIHINKQKGRVEIECNRLVYRDKDTRQIVIYVPSLDLSGYGATQKKAEEMLQFSVNDMFTQLLGLSTDKLSKKLAEFGWEKDKLRKKDFSKAYIDIEGNLKGFNAVGDKVDIERATMTV